MDFPSNSVPQGWTPATVAAENARFMTRVYGWMAAGLCLTGLVASSLGQNEELALAVVQNRPLFWGLVIAQFGAVLALSGLIQRMSAMVAGLVFFAYAALTGVTLSTIFLVYSSSSIVEVFGLTAFSFAGLSAFGLVTKRDLGPVGSFCTMGLFGLVGFSLLSLFFPSMRGAGSNFVMSMVGLLVFSGLTAYDTQKIKAMNIIGNEGTDEDRKEAVSGALTLYLDFVNLFLSLLRLLGRSRD